MDIWFSWPLFFLLITLNIQPYLCVHLSHLSLLRIARSTDPEFLWRVRRQVLTDPQPFTGPAGVLEVPIPTNIGHFPGASKQVDACDRDEIVTEDGTCQALLTDGNCGLQEIVLLDPDTNKGFCAPRLCPPDRVFVPRTQLCHDPQDLTVCPPGRELYYSAYGTAVCSCPEGTVEGDDDLDDDVCELVLGESLQCLPGQVFWFKDFNSPPECLPDPCGGLNLNKNTSELPFVPSRENGKCFQIGQMEPVCTNGTIYSLSLEDLKGECITLEDAGFNIFEPDELAMLKKIYGDTITPNTAAPITVPPGSLQTSPQQTTTGQITNGTSLDPQIAGDGVNQVISVLQTVGEMSTGNSTDIKPGILQAASGSSVSQTGSSVTQTGSLVPQTGSSVTQTGSSIPQVGSSVSQTESFVPQTGSSVSQVGSLVPQAGSSVSQTESLVPQTGSSVSQTGSLIPQAGSSVSQAGSFIPQTGSSVSQTGSSVSQTGSSVPQTGSSVPQPGSSVSQTGSKVSPGVLVSQSLGNQVQNNLIDSNQVLTPASGQGNKIVKETISNQVGQTQDFGQSMNVIGQTSGNNGQISDPNQHKIIVSPGLANGQVSQSTNVAISNINNEQILSNVLPQNGITNQNQVKPSQVGQSSSIQGSQSVQSNNQVQQGQVNNQGIKTPQDIQTQANTLPQGNIIDQNLGQQTQVNQLGQAAPVANNGQRPLNQQNVAGGLIGQGSQSQHQQLPNSHINQPHGQNSQANNVVQNTHVVPSGQTSPSISSQPMSNNQQISIEMGGQGSNNNSPEVGVGSGTSANSQNSFEVGGGPFSTFGYRFGRSLGFRRPPVRGILTTHVTILPSGEIIPHLVRNSRRLIRNKALNDTLNAQQGSIIKYVVYEDPRSNDIGHSRRKRNVLSYASPSNVFETRLLGCRPGAVRDINAKCRNTVLPAKIPKRRGTRAAPPVPPTPSCPSGMAFNLRRRCVPSGTAQNNILAYNLG